jgi:hypothetical protein
MGLKKANMVETGVDTCILQLWLALFGARSIMTWEFIVNRFWRRESILWRGRVACCKDKAKTINFLSTLTTIS